MKKFILTSLACLLIAAFVLTGISYSSTNNNNSGGVQLSTPTVSIKNFHESN